MRLRHALAALMVSASSAGAMGIADAYSSFWVLGDSLSDDGNLYAASGLPPSPPYWEGRFSNGPVWNEAIAAEFAAAGKATGNVAYGGAKAITDGDLIPDLDLQLLLLAAEAAGRLGTRPLASIWFGANDLFNAPSEATADAAAAAVLAGISTLSGAGFADFITFTLPEMAVPFADRFNLALASGIAGLPSLDISLFDAQAIALGTALSAGSGITNITESCIVTDAGSIVSVCSEPETYAFFDEIHPNATIHAGWGAAVEAQLAPVPLPGGAGMLLLGMGALVLGRRVRA